MVRKLTLELSHHQYYLRNVCRVSLAVVTHKERQDYTMPLRNIKSYEKFQINCWHLQRYALQEPHQLSVS